MKRVLAIVALLLARDAAAKPMMVHTVWSVCAEARSWEPLTKCLERFGDVSVERTVGRVKVVRVGENASGAGPGLYLYAEDRAGLHLVGMWQLAAGARLELLAIDQVSVRGHEGFRLDLGSIEPTSIALDADAVVEATMQRRTTTFCLDSTWRCTEAVQSCDILVAGKAYFTFRGALALTNGTLTLAGDRSHAGACAPPERIPLVDGAP